MIYYYYSKSFISCTYMYMYPSIKVCISTVYWIGYIVGFLLTYRWGMGVEPCNYYQIIIWEKSPISRKVLKLVQLLTKLKLIQRYTFRCTCTVYILYIYCTCTVHMFCSGLYSILVLYMSCFIFILHYYIL